MAEKQAPFDFGAAFNFDNDQPKAVDVGDYNRKRVQIMQIEPVSGKTGDFFRVTMFCHDTKELIQITASLNTYIGRQCEAFMASGYQLPAEARILPHGKYFKFGPLA